MKHLSLIVVSLLLAAACATSPTGRKQLIIFSDSQLNSMGSQAFTEMKSQTPKSSEIGTIKYVQCVGDAVIEAQGESPTQWELVVFDSPQLNAFALPGRKIGVYTGILKAAKNEHQLAAIIGHEVGHVIARHGNERMSTGSVANGAMKVAEIASQESDHPQKQQMLALMGLGMQYGVILPYSRTHESEADLIGLELMAKAGFNPEQSVNLWQNMARLSSASAPEFLSTHPSPDSRIRNLQQHMPHALSLYNAAKKTSCQ